MYIKIILPIFYIILFLFLLVNVDFLIKFTRLKWFFFTDYLNKYLVSCFFLLNLKFLDLFLNVSISKGFSVSTFFSLKRNYLLKGNVRVVFVLIILFFFI